MKPILLFTITAALLATGAASASNGVSGATLKLTSVQTQFSTVPPISKSAPPAVGGRMIFEDVLYNRAPQFGKPAGARVGTASIVCTIVSKTSLACSINARVPDGQLVLAGSIAMGSHTNAYAITGGVGAYANATGSASGHDVGSTKSLVTIHLG
jgi:hypothetical protein